VERVKLVAELRPGEVTETEVARIERDEQAGTADLGLGLTETKQLMAALQDQIVPAQMALVGERCRSCVSYGRMLASKGRYPVTFCSLFGDVPGYRLKPGGLAAISPGGRPAEHRESGMNRVAMTYRLCSPPRFETISVRLCGQAVLG
jgi:hypothetical protein